MSWHNRGAAGSFDDDDDDRDTPPPSTQELLAMWDELRMLAAELLAIRRQMAAGGAIPAGALWRSLVQAVRGAGGTWVDRICAVMQWLALAVLAWVLAIAVHDMILSLLKATSVCSISGALAPQNAHKSA